jgi:hypothetical protein
VRGGAFATPSTAALPLGDAPPAIYLAFDPPDGAHLSGLGLMIETLPLGGPLANALAQSPWHILDATGAITERGTLRPRPSAGGTRRLAWLDEGTGANPDAERSIAAIDSGPYGNQVFVFPPVPPERATSSSAPAAITSALPALLLPDQMKGLAKPLVWVHVPLPPGLTGVASGLQRLAVNAVTVSNMEIVAEQVPFDRMGSVVTLEPEGKRGRFLMGVLGISGEHGMAYAPDAALDVPLDGGRWRYRDGRLDLRPAVGATGRLDTYAMIRLLYCDGASANGIDPGAIRQIGLPLTNVTAHVANLVPTRAGAAPPEYAPAKLRFAELVRTRERVVTAADAEIAARVFEPRIRAIAVAPISSMVSGYARHGQRVTATIRRSEFADADGEAPRLEAQLTHHLQQRAVLGFDVVVTVVIDD